MKRFLLFFILIVSVFFFFSRENATEEKISFEDTVHEIAKKKIISSPKMPEGIVAHSYMKEGGRSPASVMIEVPAEVPVTETPEVEDTPAISERMNAEEVSEDAGVVEEERPTEPGMALYGKEKSIPPAPSPARNVSSFVGGGWPSSSAPVPSPTARTSDEPSPSSSSSSGGCSPSHAPGTYEEPIDVTLTCSGGTRFCLQANTCCDPQTVGTVYTGIIPVGAAIGDYCLSYMDGSKVTELTFSFVPDVPDLTVTAARTHFQATELPHSSWGLESSFFGEEKYSLSQVNYLSADPSAMACADIVNDPTPRETLAPFTLENETDGIPFAKTILDADLDYGPNYITTIARNISWADVSTCDHQLIVLEDFEYFEEYGNVHPFASTESNLHTGLYSVFYEESP